MKKEAVVLDYEYYDRDCNFEDLKCAVEKLTRSTEAQFKEIKSEKWFNRLFDIVTFSHKGKKRMAEQIGSLAQAQEILLEILVRLSSTDEKVAEHVRTCFDDILRLQKNDNYLLSIIQRLENICKFGIREIEDVKRLTSREKQILSGCLRKLCSLYQTPSAEQQQYANNLLDYIAVEAEIEDISKAVSDLEEKSRCKILTCMMEYMSLADEALPNEEQDEFIENFDLGSKTIKKIKKQINDTYRLRGARGLIDKFDQFEQVRVDDIFYVEVPETETQGASKDATDTVHTIAIIYTKGNEEFAKQIGTDLQMIGNTVEVVADSDKIENVGQSYDWKIYVGKSDAANRVTKTGKIDILVNQYGCLIKTVRGSRTIVLYQEKDYDLSKEQDAFIAYYQKAIEQYEIENKEIEVQLKAIASQKAVYEKCDGSDNIPMRAWEGMLQKTDEIADIIEGYSSNPIRKVGSVLFRAASLPVAAVTGIAAFAAGAVPELTSAFVLDVVADGTFDGKIKPLMQQDILRVELRKFILEKRFG